MWSKIISFLCVIKNYWSNIIKLVYFSPFGVNAPSVIYHILYFCIFVGLFLGSLSYLVHWSRSIYWLLGQFYTCLIIICHHTPWYLIMKLTLCNITIQKFGSVPSHQFWLEFFSLKKKIPGKNSTRDDFLKFLIINVFRIFTKLDFQSYSSMSTALCFHLLVLSFSIPGKLINFVLCVTDIKFYTLKLDFTFFMI